MFSENLANNVKTLWNKIRPVVKDSGANQIYDFRDIDVLWADFTTGSATCTKVHDVSCGPKLRRRSAELNSNTSRSTETVNTNSSNNGTMVDTYAAVDASLN